MGRIKSRPGPSLLTLFLSLVSVFATLIRSIGSYSHRLCGDQESLDHLQPRDARTKLSLSHEHDCKMQVLHSFFVSGSDFFCVSFVSPKYSRVCLPQPTLSWVRDPRTKESQSLRLTVPKTVFLTALSRSFPDSRLIFVCCYVVDADFI